MGEHPDKFFVWWDIPPLAYGDEGQAENLKWFNHWMMDTLAAGIDTSFGAVPNNVYFFNYYYYMTDHEQYLFQPAIWTGETSHPNTAGALYVAPYFVNETFDAAIDYESNFPASVGFNSISTYSLDQNYPNPFNPSTEINFSLAESGFISLKVYDISGAEVATLENGFKHAGKYSIKFDAKKYISGIYFYRLNTDNFSSTRKMVLIK